MTRQRATMIGFAAVFSWSFFAVLAVATSPVPPLLLNALSFGLGGVAGLIWTAANGRLGLLTQVRWPVYAVGTAGLFGYHFLYFSALRVGPPAEVMLVNYLWPLLIVLGSGLLPGERLRRTHVIGGIIAFGGAALVVAGRNASFDSGALMGYGMALSAAVIWAVYSLISRRMGRVPTETVAVFCVLTAVLSAILHASLETTAFPATWTGWGAIAVLGLGPVGAAFYAWDIGMKRGDVQLLGVGSYTAPLLSTLILVMTGISPATSVLFVAAVLIAGGAALAAWAPR